MAQVETEQEVLAALQNFVKEHLGGDVEKLTSDSLRRRLRSFVETARPDVRVDLAEMCSRMSLAIMRETNNLEGKNGPATRMRFHVDFLKEKPNDQNQLAWAQKALKLLCKCDRSVCQCKDISSDFIDQGDDVIEKAKDAKEVALYCGAMAMFTIGHLISAKSEFKRLKEFQGERAAASPNNVYMCEHLKDSDAYPYRLLGESAMVTTEQTLDSLETVGSYEKTRGVPRQLFTMSQVRDRDRKKELGIHSPCNFIDRVGDKTPGNRQGVTIEKFSPESNALKQKKNEIMTIYSPPSGRDRDILLESLEGLNGSVKDIVAVSWNVQLMNTFDVGTGNMMQAIEDKAKNAAKAAENPGILGANQRNGASLLVIQEAPGPQLRKATKGGILWDVAENLLFTKELKKQPYFRNFKFQEVALSLSNKQEEYDKTHDKKKKTEKGEDHIFGWNPSRLEPVKHEGLENPAPLEAPKGKDWQARAPSWAAFNVGSTKTTLIVVSVHAKSGGNTETQEDIKMIGEAVNKLWDKWDSKRKQDEDLIVLMVGDFNYASSKVFPDRLLDSNLYCLAEQFRTDIKTNIWMFNGTGEEESGESYDYGFVRSVIQGKAGEVKAKMNVPPVVSKELEEVQKEMKQLGQQMRPFFKSCLQIESDDEEMEDEPRAKSEDEPRKSIRRKVAKSMMEKFKKDSVPSWMREEFKKVVKLMWSDHMPIAIGLSIPDAPQQSPSSTSQGSPQKPLPPVPRVNRKLTSELAGAKGGE